MQRLPTDSSRRAAALVARSRPDPMRPRLSDPELEARMSELESRQAIDYAMSEDMCDRLFRLGRTLEESEDGVILDELEDDSSLVVRIAEAAEGMCTPRPEDR